VDRFPLQPQDQKRLALSLGFEQLPPPCAAVLGDTLAAHVTSARVLRERDNQYTAGGVLVAIVKACNAVEELTAVERGIDADTRRTLKPAAEAFLAAADERLQELRAMPRIYPERELLRETCSRLRLIFDQHAAPDFKVDRTARRRFAFDALTAAGIRLPSIDDAHLTRLDDFLDASPQPPA
jgi:hypothetical protein